MYVFITLLYNSRQIPGENGYGGIGGRSWPPEHPLKMRPKKQTKQNKRVKCALSQHAHANLLAPHSHMTQTSPYCKHTSTLDTCIMHVLLNIIISFVNGFDHLLMSFFRSGGSPVSNFWRGTVKGSSDKWEAAAVCGVSGHTESLSNGRSGLVVVQLTPVNPWMTHVKALDHTVHI